MTFMEICEQLKKDAGAMMDADLSTMEVEAEFGIENKKKSVVIKIKLIKR